MYPEHRATPTTDYQASDEKEIPGVSESESHLNHSLMSQSFDGQRRQMKMVIHAGRLVSDVQPIASKFEPAMDDS